MGEIMKSILLMSAAGGALALLLLCIKPITRKFFSPKWQYYIWLTVLIVMVLPIQFSMPAKQADIPSVNTAVQSGQNVTMQANTENVQTPVLNELSEKPAVKIPEIPINIVHISGFIWLAAALLILGYKLTKYAVFLRAIRKNAVPCTMENVPARLAVRKTDLLDAPLIVGLVKPVLYLPQGEIGQEELAYILLHELTHYKRYDILYKWFTMLVASVHWFNPFVYIVSKQIDEECEVSCDYTVCKKLTEPQKNSYMAMILDFVGASIRQKRPLTTQMASSKKTLTRRFMMIKNKKQASKFVSVLSVILAFVMLSTTVFASNVLSDLTTDDYTIDILNHNGEKIELSNKPFIENSVVYVPLRETFEKAGVMDNERSYINWDNGKIEMNITHDNENIACYLLEIGKNDIQLKHIKPNETSDGDSVKLAVIVLSNNGFHKLKGSITYVSLESANYMLYSYLNIRDKNNNLQKLTYNIYDKNGNDIGAPFTAEEVAAARAVVEEYYRAGNAKDRQAILATLTSWADAPNVKLASDDKSFVTIKEIRYNSYYDDRMSYITNGRGSINGAKIEDVIVFKMDFDVSFPDGTTVEEMGAWQPEYKDWSMILIRNGKEGKWLIDDMGY